jgi:putative endonuclease
MPWQLVYVQCFESKKEALLREKHLKKYSHIQIEQLIQSSLNKLCEFTLTHYP